MKLLHLIHSLNPEGGGPANFVRQMSALQADLDFQMEIACLDSPLDPYDFSRFPCRVHPLGPGWLGYGYTAKLLPWLAEHHSDYDLAVVHGIWQYHSLATCLASSRLKAPYVVFTHGMLDPWFNRNYPLKHLKKMLYWPWAEYRVLSEAQAVLFTCEEERLLARQSFSPYRVNEIVVGLGTPAAPDNREEQVELFLTKFPNLRNKRLILFLGRIHEKKGVDLLLSAFARIVAEFPDLALVLGGPFEAGYAGRLQAHLQAGGQPADSQVVWTGMLLDDLKWGAIRTAEALILPSHQENFGQVVSEALSCSTPVLISNKVNIWREIEQDQAGLVENDDQQGVQNLLQRWLSLEPGEKQRMKERAKLCFDNRFDIRQMVSKLLPVLEQCAGGQGGS